MNDRNRETLRVVTRVVNGILLEEVMTRVKAMPEDEKDPIDPKQRSEIFVIASVVGYLTALTAGRIGDLKDLILMNTMPGPGGKGGD